MLFFCLIIAITAQSPVDYTKDLLAGYPGLNAGTIKGVIHRDSAYMKCMFSIHQIIMKCVDEAMGGRRQGYFFAPNKCQITFQWLPDCTVTLPLIIQINTELMLREFKLTYGLMTNSNVPLTQLQALGLTPTIMTIAW